MTSTTTLYLDGYQYVNGNLEFFPVAGAYVKKTENIGATKRWYDYVFNYTDHLGNIRLSYTLDYNTNKIKILEENHYYPFGLKHRKYNNLSSDIQFNPSINNRGLIPILKGKTYKYKYQGQERQDELNLNWDSFKWRNYDFAIGRFMSVDPLAEEYTDWGPYVFSGNIVVHAREIEGLEPHILFSSRTKATENFAQQYNGKSIKQGREYGGRLYSLQTTDGRTLYAYNTPTRGSNDGVNPNTTIPSNGKGEGIIHSHGKYETGYDNNEFSPADKNYAKGRNEDIFVVTPNGLIIFYDVDKDTPSDDGTVIRANAPSDPNDPDRKNYIKPDPNLDPVKTKPVKIKTNNTSNSGSSNSSGTTPKSKVEEDDDTV